MTPIVFAAVLLGAALHASWNAIVKGGPDKLMTTVLIAAASGLVAAAVLPFLPLPARASWPFLAASAVVQVVYFGLVAGAYAATDMSRAYPLMRGLAPALVALAGVGFLGEHLDPAAWAGVALISSGVFGMTFAFRGPASRLGTLLALLNAGVIAGYTLIDGAGVRLSGNAKHDRRLGPGQGRDHGCGSGGAWGRESPGSVERGWPGRVLGLGRDAGGGAESRRALHL